MPGAKRRPNSMRYDGYDYTWPGAYFVTYCAYHGRSIFGQIVDHEMRLNPLGEIADQYWPELAANHAHVLLDTHVIMPNHGHVLLLFRQDPEVGAASAPVKREFGKPIARSLSTLVGTYKAEVTRRAERRRLIPSPPIWQGGFWDRIIRDERELQTVRDYIRNNPARWLEDQLHPDAPPNRFNGSWR